MKREIPPAPSVILDTSNGTAELIPDPDGWQLVRRSIQWGHRPPIELLYAFMRVHGVPADLRSYVAQRLPGDHRRGRARPKKSPEELKRRANDDLIQFMMVLLEWHLPSDGRRSTRERACQIVAERYGKEGHLIEASTIDDTIKRVRRRAKRDPSEWGFVLAQEADIKKMGEDIRAADTKLTKKDKPLKKGVK